MTGIFVKHFLEWIGVKQKLDTHDYTPPLVNEGDIWWCAIGENIGVETSGKGRNFTRPVIIIKKFGRLAFFGIPLTSKKTGRDMVRFSHSQKYRADCHALTSSILQLQTTGP
jgi:hypothetical protein